MASIRRTLSPAHHDRPYQNGASVSSPSHKILLSTTSTYSPSTLPSAVAVFALNFRRKGFTGLRKAFSSWAIFFLIGFLLGMMPLGHVDDIRARDISFDLKPSHVSVRFEDEATEAGGRGDEPVRPEQDLMVDVRLGIESQAETSDGLVFLPRKELIVVTPTYNRPLQAYFLNRLGQVLRLVPPPLLWIVVEMKSASLETADILRKTGVIYRHLVCTKNSTDGKDQGVHQRNTALEHIEHHRLDGIVYFADDDNIYSLELFYSMRNICCFGTWPVAMLAQGKNKAILEGPVCNGSQVIGWHTNEKSKKLRRFHVDMSGFAFNSTILWDPKRWRRPTSIPIRQLDTEREGFQETTFLQQMIEDESQMEGTPVGCSRIMNWHLHLEVHGRAYPKGWLLQKNLDVAFPLK